MVNGGPARLGSALLQRDPQLAAFAELLSDVVGARPAAAIVARRLRALGVRGVPRGPRPSTQENPAGLTTRELEVLAPVAEGLRNAEIAERLIVTRKTVDHHVSAILRKLDAPTRGQAAAAAIRLGLLQRADNEVRNSARSADDKCHGRFRPDATYAGAARVIS